MQLQIDISSVCKVTEELSVKNMPYVTPQHMTGTEGE
jgi:hypothetical protein